MKKIIDGKLYNTATAEAVDSYDNGLYGTFRYWEEALYRKKTGEYFLYGYGGPATEYSEQVGPNEYGSGERIIPLTAAEAKTWMEKYGDVDTYIKYFGEPEE